MASAPISSIDLIDLVRKSGLASERLDSWLRNNPALPPQVHVTAAKLVDDGLLTPFHAKHMLTGKYKGFVLGQYKVLDQIGAGGMGVIFLAEHMTMKRQVAIKVLPGDKASDEESRERFYREARIVAALDHPNVVHAYDVDRSGDTHFIVLEYIDGESLEHLVRRKGPLPIREAADYIAQAACGLQHAHERGLVHRDIKPGNLLVDKSGVLKVLDMGLARFFEESSTLTTELCSGSVIGTADYMAPEQAVNSHDVDIRADIYSLGITFYAMLTGQPPFASANVTQKLLAHHMREPEPIHTTRPDVPDELADIVMKMMAKQPGDRYQTPAEVADALTEWLKVNKLSEAPTAKNERTIIQRQLPPQGLGTKKRWALPAAIASGLVVVIGIIIAIGAADDKQPEKPIAKDTTTSIPGETKSTPPVVPPKIVVKEPKVGELRRLDTNNEQVERLALAPNQPIVVGGSRSGWIKIWDIDTGALLKDFRPHSGVVWCVTFSPTGRQLASCGQDSTIRIWNTSTWKEEKKLSVPKGAVWSAAFSPDGNQLFSGGDDGIGRFWNVETGSQIRTCDKPHAKAINWVAWSPDGNFVYTASWDGSVCGWDAATGVEKFRFKFDKENRFQMVAVSLDSSLLLCAGEAPAMHLLDARTGARKRPFSTDKMATQWCAMFSKDGSLAVSSGNEHVVRVWDVDTGTPYWTTQGLPNGHTEGVSGCVISDDGQRIITASKDKTVRIWAVPPR